jgi:hypothetical protein
MTVTTPRTARPSRAVLSAAWAFPLMVLGQFALLGGIPVAVALAGTLRGSRRKAARWWTACSPRPTSSHWRPGCSVRAARRACRSP